MLLAGAHHSGRRGQRARQGRQCAQCLALLHEADDGIEQDHAENHAGIHPGAQHEFDHDRGQQDIDQRLVKLQQETQQWPLALALRQNVGAEVLLSLLDLETVQTFLRIGVEQVQHLVPRQVVPVFLHQGFHIGLSSVCEFTELVPVTTLSRLPCIDSLHMRLSRPRQLGRSLPAPRRG